MVFGGQVALKRLVRRYVRGFSQEPLSEGQVKEVYRN
jgi:hypothetical protein